MPKPRKPTEERVCEGCGALFTRQNTKGPPPRWHSLQCQEASKRARRLSPPLAAARQAAPPPVPAEAPEVLDLGAQIRREMAAVDRGIEALDQTIEEIRALKAQGSFNPLVAKLLAQMVNARSSSLAKLRGFSERIRTESLDLTPEQQRRTVLRFLQTMPQAVLAEARALLDQRIEGVELIFS